MGENLSSDPVSPSQETDENQRLERRVAELELELADLRTATGFRQLFRDAPFAVFRTTPGGRILEVNPACARLFGYASAEEMAFLVDDVGSLLYAQPQRREEILQQAQASDSWTTAENTYRRRDGSSFYGRLQYRLNRYDDGRPSHLEGVIEDVSERHRAREELRQSEERFRLSFHGSPLASALIGADCRLVQVNQAFSELTGREAGELEGQDFRDLVHPDDLPQTLIWLEALARGDIDDFQLELRYRYHGDREVLARLSLGAIRDPGGELTHYLALSEDISGQRRMEAALDQALVRYRDLFNSAGDAIFIHEVGGPFLEANQVARERLGYGLEELAAMTPLDLAPPEIVERAQARLERIVREGEAFFETIQVSRDGRRIPTEISARLIDYNGAPAVLAVARDISQRKQAQERYRAVLENAPFGVFLMDPDNGRLLLANRRLGRLLGCPHRELMSRPFWDFVSPPERPFLRRRLEALAVGDPEADQPLILTGRRLGGETFRCELGLSRAPHPAGEAVQGVLNDITARERLEAQLRLAHKMQAMGTMAGGIAHDFNNLLGAIAGYAELAQTSAQDGQSPLEDLRAILETCDRARDLVRQILAFAKTGEQARRPVRLATLVRESAGMLRATLPAMVELVLDFREERGLVRADPSELNQVIMNLVANAGQAMGGEGGTVTLKVEAARAERGETLGFAALAPGDYLLMSVIDDGPGIPPEIQDQIFDPFFTTRSRGGGTGMGLAVVHGVVASLGGEVRLEGGGPGAQFVVALPLAEEETPSPRRPRGKAPGGSERLVFIDDETDLVEVTTRMLTRLGYRVESFTSGLDALEAIAADPQGVDLLITDQAMPRLTGVQTIRKVRRLRPDLPVIIVTGFSEYLVEEEVAALQVRKVLLKPLTQMELATAVREALDQGIPYPPTDPH